jgi:hypothetical protein
MSKHSWIGGNGMLTEVVSHRIVRESPHVDGGFFQAFLTDEDIFCTVLQGRANPLSFRRWLGHWDTTSVLLNLSERGLADDKLFHLLSNAPERSIILIEDVDAAFNKRVQTSEDGYVGQNLRKV